jgi:hypothetical protein
VGTGNISAQARKEEREAGVMVELYFTVWSLVN